MVKKKLSRDTSIRVSKKVRVALIKKKRKGETFNSLIKRKILRGKNKK